MMASHRNVRITSDMLDQVTRVGCKRDARKALRGDLIEIGQGAYRRTFRDARGEVAYKVCHEPSQDHANRDEADIVKRCRQSQSGQNYVLPTTVWIVDGVAIVAQPMLKETARERYRRVQGSPEAYDEFDLAERDIEDAADALGIGDIHWGNWGFDASGHAWIIDAQFQGSVGSTYYAMTYQA